MALPSLHAALNLQCRRCNASLQRPIFKMDAVLPPCSAPPSMQALLSFLRRSTFITVAAKRTCQPVYVCADTLLLLCYCASISHAPI